MNKCLKCKDLIEGQPVYGLHHYCFAQWFELPIPSEFLDVDPKNVSSGLSIPDIKKKKDTFFHGRYKKYSARLGSVSYILKVQETEFPELPIVEYLCNEIASLLKIEVPAYHLINFNECITFVTRNFMQDHIGTLDHIYKFLPLGEENYNCTEIIAAILKETEKISEVAKFIEICLFDALIGNNDRHGRNLAIITTLNKKKLAPMYDNPSFLGIEDQRLLGAHFNTSGSIWTTKNKEPKLLDYITEFVELGYEMIVKQFCNKAISQSKNIFNIIDNAEISKQRKQAFIKFLTMRLEEFENAKQI